MGAVRILSWEWEHRYEVSDLSALDAHCWQNLVEGSVVGCALKNVGMCLSVSRLPFGSVFDMIRHFADLTPISLSVWKGDG